jgi:heat-inducible transcriptional repressor
MTSRHRRILAALVAEYIEQGEPISSAWLADHSSLGVSSATVRNILARLEEQGLLRQPHTSAGRIPTDSGYRLYVDTLLEARRSETARQ